MNINEKTDAAFEARLEKYAQEWALIADDGDKRNLHSHDWEVYVRVQESDRDERLANDAEEHRREDSGLAGREGAPRQPAVSWARREPYRNVSACVSASSNANTTGTRTKGNRRGNRGD